MEYVPRPGVIGSRPAHVGGTEQGDHGCVEGRREMAGTGIGGDQAATSGARTPWSDRCPGVDPPARRLGSGGQRGRSRARQSRSPGPHKTRTAAPASSARRRASSAKCVVGQLLAGPKAPPVLRQTTRLPRIQAELREGCIRRRPRRRVWLRARCAPSRPDSPAGERASGRIRRSARAACVPPHRADGAGGRSRAARGRGERSRSGAGCPRARRPAAERTEFGNRTATSKCDCRSRRMTGVIRSCRWLDAASSGMSSSNQVVPWSVGQTCGLMMAESVASGKAPAQCPKGRSCHDRVADQVGAEHCDLHRASPLATIANWRREMLSCRVFSMRERTAA